ncbi:hypothetical protein QAD02_016602 [Eretmocerus hayati]|uniref:Uncharacterized protein n=1 Tax=Eretmocerus hayati TaxID=131215 RepID=A0ACC2PB39_9HYME|nr:hypothetical protein QAD02_016602 [Eretmocerus hayati]
MSTISRIAGTLGLPPTVTFHWNLCISPSTDVVQYNSPSFWLRDSSGFEHEWRLEVEVIPNSQTPSSASTTNSPHTFRFGFSPPQPTFSFSSSFGGFAFSKIRLVYLGEGEISLSSIGFQLSLKTLLLSTSSEIYNDLKQNNASHSFDYSSSSATPQALKTKQFNSTDSSYVINLNTAHFQAPCNIEVVCEIVAHTVSVYTKRVADEINMHDLSLKTELEELFESGQFSDVTVIVEKKELHLHKSILSKRSDVFAAMFEHDLEESKSNRVNIDDLSYEVMREFFRYMYAAKINNMENLMSGLLVASEKYAVEGLKTLCENCMIKALSFENAIECVNLANIHNAKKLETECIKFITSNASHIVEQSKYDLSILPGDLINTLYSALAKKSSK